jgi:hypothetical protein
MATFRSSPKNTRKLNLQLVPNIELFLIHTELELGVLVLPESL